MITITPSATQYLVNLLRAYDKPVVELSLEEQGCNGYKYVWNPTTTNLGKDNSIALDNEYSIVFSKEIALQIAGSTVDIEVDKLVKRLVINNPNVANSCGCGESVNFK